MDMTAKRQEKCPRRSKLQVAVFSNENPYKLADGSKSMYSFFRQIDIA